MPASKATQKKAESKQPVSAPEPVVAKKRNKIIS